MVSHCHRNPEEQDRRLEQQQRQRSIPVNGKRLRAQSVDNRASAVGRAPSLIHRHGNVSIFRFRKLVVATTGLRLTLFYWVVPVKGEFFRARRYLGRGLWPFFTGIAAGSSSNWPSFC